MSDTFKSVVFALATAVICSLLLTAASSGLKPFQQENIEVDRKKNILKSIGLVEEGRVYGSEAIKSMYAENITGVHVDDQGRIVEAGQAGDTGLPIYLYTRGTAIEAYVLPIDSRGLWGRIYGYLALESDGTTVSGFTVYQHSETPGLGGEIEKSWFQNNFKGKRIVDSAGNFVSITIAKPGTTAAMPEAAKVNHVDGISGATLTGRFLSAGLEQILREYEPVSMRFRSKEMRVLPGTTSQGDGQ